MLPVVRNMQALVGPLAGSLLAFLVFWLIYSTPDADPRLAAPLAHFWVVSLTSLLAVAVAVVVGVAGARAGDSRVVFLAGGFASMAGFFALHGLSTPFVLLGPNVVTPIASQLAMIAFAASMVAAAYLRPCEGRGSLARTLAGWVGAIVLFDVVLMARPDLARFVPVHLAPLKHAVAVVVIGLLALAGTRFLESYRLARSSIHLVMLHVVGWVMVAQLIMTLGETFRLSWWLYHLVLLLAVTLMLVTFARQLRAGQLGSDLNALLDDDAVRRLAYGLRPEVRALVVATEAKDHYTAGHMQRVAELAVRVGKRMGLQAEDLRVLAQAGVIHDVGKIEVPDAVLNKPTRLEPHERDLIEQHPANGERIGRTLGLHRLELEVIRHHHERWDGSGYPDKLEGGSIPLLARIMAVADVYDALTSARAYRPAWTQEAARTLLQREAGTSFDPRVVAATLEVLRGDAQPVAARQRDVRLTLAGAD
ncbi:MAG TPA: HD-GYP domain-containing protein [Trueperaceae bacterium]|nr:HD-GYP domain-containing protein [Trueperaceae bacterium]